MAIFGRSFPITRRYKFNSLIYPPIAADCLFFDGVNDYVSVPTGGGLDGLQTGTIEMWVKWTGTQDAGYASSCYGPVIARQKDGVFSNQIIALDGSNPASAKVVWKAYTYGSTELTSTSTVGNGTWVHIAITYSSGSHKMYINGVLEATSSTTGTINTDNPTVLSLGAWIGGGDGFANAQLDEVRIWDKILTLAEIQATMSCEIPTSYANLLANYHFNQGIAGGSNPTETSLTDSSGNGYNGTLTNFALSGATSNWIKDSSPASGTICVFSTVTTKKLAMLGVG